MKIYARQGDLIIEKLEQPLTGDLIPRTDVVFAGDSSGHRHRLLGVAQVSTDASGGATRFRIAEATQLVHQKPDGHKTVEMEPGDYEIRPLRERGDGSDRAVED